MVKRYKNGTFYTFCKTRFNAFFLRQCISASKFLKNDLKHCELEKTNIVSHHARVNFSFISCTVSSSSNIVFYATECIYAMFIANFSLSYQRTQFQFGIWNKKNNWKIKKKRQTQTNLVLTTQLVYKAKGIDCCAVLISLRRNYFQLKYTDNCFINFKGIHWQQISMIWYGTRSYSFNSRVFSTVL